jgi:DNA topoisomerase-1
MELDEALRLLETKQGREVLKELGPHPKTGAELRVLSGRYGPYVTDGTVNASVPKNVDPTQLVIDEAVELLSKAEARKGKGKRKRSAGKGGGKGRSSRSG